MEQEKNVYKIIYSIGGVKKKNPEYEKVIDWRDKPLIEPVLNGLKGKVNEMLCSKEHLRFFFTLPKDKDGKTIKKAKIYKLKWCNKKDHILVKNEQVVQEIVRGTQTRGKDGKWMVYYRPSDEGGKYIYSNFIKFIDHLNFTGIKIDFIKNKKPCYVYLNIDINKLSQDEDYFYEYLGLTRQWRVNERARNFDITWVFVDENGKAKAFDNKKDLNMGIFSGKVNEGTLYDKPINFKVFEEDHLLFETMFRNTISEALARYVLMIYDTDENSIGRFMKSFKQFWTVCHNFHEKIKK
jgi:hypothetical protein